MKQTFICFKLFSILTGNTIAYRIRIVHTHARATFKHLQIEHSLLITKLMIQKKR